ncbi:hypothetical protein C8R47DRAFT_1083067 [Mycena vitilis]|nr:hypothetical protein C8R47DRAFT_1083067 [Mycena vitilis]
MIRCKTFSWAACSPSASFIACTNKVLMTYGKLSSLTSAILENAHWPRGRFRSGNNCCNFPAQNHAILRRIGICIQRRSSTWGSQNLLNVNSIPLVNSPEQERHESRNRGLSGAHSKPLPSSVKQTLLFFLRHFASQHMSVPATDEQVSTLYMEVRRKSPLQTSHDKLSSINDLFVHAWVPCVVASSNVIDMSVGRIFVDKLPNTDTVLEFPFSIIYVPPTSPGNTRVPRNKCAALRSDVEWRGNILVVKHGKRKPVINVEPEDASLVDTIVNAYLDEELLD